MKRILCLIVCLLMLLGGCTLGTTDSTNSITHGTADAVSSAADKTIDYYFMAGEGGKYTTGDYFTKWGDSCLIVFPNGQTMLVDTGMKSYYANLKQKLHSLGVYELDYLVFSHSHSDHCGAAWDTLFVDFKIGQVYHNGVSSKKIENVCKTHSVSCSVLEKGDRLEFGQGDTLVTMKVLWPSEEAKKDFGNDSSSAAINNQSLVMRFDYGEHASLFTGDLYKTYKGTKTDDEVHIPGKIGSEERLAAMYTNGELDVDLLKLPHHGDPSTSNSRDFFTATTPELAVATGFLPVESGYSGVYCNRGYTGTVLFDRKYGYIHVSASGDGTMEYETSRSDYLPDYGRKWNTALERKAS